MNNNEESPNRGVPIPMFIYRFAKKYDESYLETLGEPAYLAFTEGYCWHFARLLNRLYPESTLYSDNSHVRCQIGKYLYDIEGDHELTKEYLPILNAEDEAYATMYFSRGDYDKKIDQILNQLGEATINELHDEIYPQGKSR